MSCLDVRLINERLFYIDNLLSSWLLCKTGHLKEPSASVKCLGEIDVLWFYGTHGHSPCNWGFSHHLHMRWSWMAPPFQVQIYFWDFVKSNNYLKQMIWIRKRGSLLCKLYPKSEYAIAISRPFMCNQLTAFWLDRDSIFWKLSEVH